MNFINKSKKIFSLLLVVALMATSVSFVSFSSDDETVIYILHTNDMHGRVREGRFDGMGLDRVAAVVNDFRKTHNNVLLVDAGDTVHGMPFATLDRGASYVRLMNAMGYNLMVPGNHDFNYGQERLLELDAMAEFPMIAANVIVESTGEYFMKPYEIVEIDGVKIGFFGLATPETLFKSHPAGTRGLIFEDPIEASQRMVDHLEDQVDIIVGLAHLGNDESTVYEHTSRAVAENVKGIDLIIDGHSHETYDTGLMVGDTLIVMANEYNKYVGVVKVTLSHEETRFEASLLSKDYAMENFEPDPVIEALIESIEGDQNVILNEVIGKSNVHLEGERSEVRVRETNLGNLLTDAMLWESEADFAFTNGGGMRTSIEVGDITRGDVVAVLPFGNQVVNKKIKGSDVHAALEVASAASPEPAGNFAHVSGLTYRINPPNEKGERVSHIMIQGEPINMDQYYIMATNDFLAAGGDGMSMFVETETVGIFRAMDEVLIDYIQKIGDVNVETEGRIVVADSSEVYEYVEYTVVAGDVLWRIARKHGTTWETIAEMNELKNPHLILIGQILKIPAQ